MIGQPRSLDEARRLFPALGFALYAYAPGLPVTLEVHDGDALFSWTADTEARVWEIAFPIDEPPPEVLASIPENADVIEWPTPAASDPSQDTALVEPPEIEADEPTPPSVFD